MGELRGSVLSWHDLSVIYGQLARIRASQFGATVTEVHISSRRLQPFGRVSVAGVPIRQREGLSLNDGVVIVDGREPVTFDFEDLTGS